MIRKLLGAIVAGLLVPTVPLKAAGACADVYVQVRTFHLSMDPARSTYRAGTTAVIKVRVTRPAQEDPVGLGVEVNHPVSFPANRVVVGVGLVLGGFLSRSATTDEDGRAKVRIPIPRRTPAGPVEARAFASQTRLNACLILEEFGTRKEPQLFRIRASRS